MVLTVIHNVRTQPELEITSPLPPPRQSLVQSSVDGYNVCICAYGQTGSGKTHTLLGDEQAPGVAPRAFQKLFQLAETRAAQSSFVVNTYMLELYNDRLVDLLAPAGARTDEKLEVGARGECGSVWERETGQSG